VITSLQRANAWSQLVIGAAIEVHCDERSAFGVWRIKYIDTLIYCVLIYLFFMDDFEQFDAFQRCREFVRAVAAPLNRGAFSKTRF
jgi:hypothetical protein